MKSSQNTRQLSHRFRTQIVVPVVIATLIENYLMAPCLAVTLVCSHLDELIDDAIVVYENQPWTQFALRDDCVVRHRFNATLLEENLIWRKLDNNGGAVSRRPTESLSGRRSQFAAGNIVDISHSSESWYTLLACGTGSQST